MSIIKRLAPAVAAAALLASLTACGGGESKPKALTPTGEATLIMIEKRMAAASEADRKWACDGDWADVLTIAELPVKADGPQAKFGKDRRAAADAYLAKGSC